MRRVGLRDGAHAVEGCVCEERGAVDVRFY